jgi:aromatic ring-opening dioxygenase catalytic subunit (LigB family)
MERLPTLYIPHGGGPCFFMDWTMGPRDTWDRMGAWLRSAGAAAIGVRPKAIIVVSAHWETDEFMVTGQRKPPLLYDYYGFPPHTYRIEYGAPGSPELAADIRDLLSDAGIPSRSDEARGLDHGVFIPFKLIYPEADIPIVQLSLKADLDPEAHIEAGHAIAPLREHGVLIVGSGMSYHNMAAYMRGQGPVGAEPFDRWLTETVEAEPARRNDRLRHWESAPAARDAHPREEHLIPLMVAAGAAGQDPGRRIYADHVMGAALSAYRFG